MHSIARQNFSQSFKLTRRTLGVIYCRQMLHSGKGRRPTMIRTSSENRGAPVEKPSIMHRNQCEHSVRSISSSLSLSLSICRCAQSLYAIKVLLCHGMNEEELRFVFKTVVLAKILYATPAWIIPDIRNWHSTDMCMGQEDQEDPRRDGLTW